MKFRFKALERQRQPDQLDSPTLLASPRGWVAVFTVLITTVMVGLWGFLGAIPRYASVGGLLSYPGGVVTVESTVPGALTGMPVRTGDTVTDGQTVGIVRTASGKSIPVAAPVAGRIVSVNAGVGNYVAPGEPVLQIEQIAPGQEELGATLVVAGDMVPFVRPGQEVTLAVPGVNTRIFGRLRGVVENVGEFPASTEQLAMVTGSAAAAPTTGYLVRVRLLADPHTASGYQWTSVSGPSVVLNSRTPIEGELSLGARKPVSILLGV